MAGRQSWITCRCYANFHYSRIHIKNIQDCNKCSVSIKIILLSFLFKNWTLKLGNNNECDITVFTKIAY